MIKTFVDRPVATSMLFLGILIFTLLTFRQISIDLLPQLDIPQFYIRTSYTDASPEEVEQFVTEGLEAQLSTLPNLRRVTSVSREGVSVITLHFHWGTDMNVARIQTRERLDQARAFLPEQAGRPSILHVDPSSVPVMKLALSASEISSVPAAVSENVDITELGLYELREAARAILKRRFEQGRGVAQALITGGVEREIRVDADIDKMRMLDVRFSDIAAELDRANISMPGGTIKSGHFRFALRALGEFESLDDIRQTVIKTTPGGRPLLLRDIADVGYGFRERESIARYNGRETVGLLIRKEAGANTIDVSRQVRRVIGELREEYPEFHIEVVYDEAEFIESAVAAVRQQLLWGGILAFTILFLFLGRIREPLVIGVSIPASIMTAILLMFVFDISINIISLGGLAVAVGMLVDNSIIVLENTNRYLTASGDLKESAVSGAREVVLPVTASTLTTIAVFLPLMFMEGLGGRLFRDQSLAITFSLLASLLVAVSFVPMLMSREMKRSDKFKTVKQLIKRFSYLIETGVLIHTTSFVLRMRDRYEKALAWSLRHRGYIMTGMLLLLAGAVVTAVWMPKEFMPQIEQGHFIAEIELEPGTAIEKADAFISDIERSLIEQPRVAAVFSSIGETEELLIMARGAGEALHNVRGELDVRLHDSAERQNVEFFIRDLVARHHGVKVGFRRPESTFERILQPSEWDILITVETGTEGEIDDALNAAEAIGKAIGQIPGLVDVQRGYEVSAPEYRLVIDRERIAAYGISVGELASTINQQVRGVIATEMTEFDQKIPVHVRTSLYQPASIDELLETHLYFSNPATETSQFRPSTLPVGEFVSYYRSAGFSEVYRERQHRVLHLRGSVRGRSVDRVINDIQDATAELGLDGVRFHIGGVQNDIDEMMGQLGWVLLISVLLIYMILASQYESVLVPLIIMAAVPMALIGAVFLLAFTGTSINLVAMIGMVVLSGIAANDAIVKVDFILRRRRGGMNMNDSIIEAGKLRFRPIVMTTSTLIFGLIPMALFAGAENHLQHPLAVAVIGGVITSTLLTLFVIPVMFSFADRFMKYDVSEE